MNMKNAKLMQLFHCACDNNIFILQGKNAIVLDIHLVNILCACTLQLSATVHH